MKKEKEKKHNHVESNLVNFRINSNKLLGNVNTIVILSEFRFRKKKINQEQFYQGKKKLVTRMQDNSPQYQYLNINIILIQSQGDLLYY